MSFARYRGPVCHSLLAEGDTPRRLCCRLKLLQVAREHYVRRLLHDIAVDSPALFAGGLDA